MVKKTERYLKYKKWSINYYKNNPANFIFRTIKRRCKLRKIKFDFTKESFKDWYDNKDRVCQYCGITELEWQNSNNSYLKSIYYKRLQVERIVPEKGYCIKNVTLACPRCNRIKSDFFNFEQMMRIGKIVREATKHT